MHISLKLCILLVFYSPGVDPGSVTEDLTESAGRGEGQSENVTAGNITSSNSEDQFPSNSLDLNNIGDGIDGLNNIGDEGGSEHSDGTRLEFVITGILSPVVFLSGIVFNIINICVLLKQGAESSHMRYLIGLSVADLAYLATSAVHWAMHILGTLDKDEALRIRREFRLEWNDRFLVIAAGRISNLTIVVMSLERFIAVKFPLVVKRSPLSRHPAKAMIVVAIFTLLLLLPNLFRSEYVEVVDSFTNESTIILRTTDFAKENKEFYVNYTIAILSILRLFPVISVFLVNAAIIIVLKTSSRSHALKHVVDNRQLKQLKVTRMLLSISFLFLLCVTPNLVNALCRNFLPSYHPLGSDKLRFNQIHSVTTLLDQVNSAANFFVYVAMSNKFRHIFLGIFCRKQQDSEENKTNQTVSEVIER